jgi:DNA primase
MSRVLKVLQRFGIQVDDKGGEKRAYGPCPFHDEPGKHDNWFIRLRGDRRGQYHCFVCKASGGLPDLVSHLRGCSLDGAKEWLATFQEDDEAPAVAYLSTRLEVEPTGRREFTVPKEVVFRPLDEWVTPAREYAQRRHLDAAQIDRWGIGYATIGRLAGRLVMPVRDATGRPRSYMARTFADHETRYYYPMERERPDQDVMFGEQFWVGRVWRKKSTVVVVEGALNALAVERAMGFTLLNVAALGGSDPRPMHVGKLASFGVVVVLTDEDKAGRGAAWELSCQLQRHTGVERVTLGEGRDADDVSPEELREAICRSIRELPPASSG